MNGEVRTLIDILRRGQHEDPTPKIELLSAALREHGTDLSARVKDVRSGRSATRVDRILKGHLDTLLAPAI